MRVNSLAIVSVLSVLVFSAAHGQGTIDSTKADKPSSVASRNQNERSYESTLTYQDYLSLGISNIGSQHYAEAVQFLTRALALRGGTAELYHYLGFAYYHLKQSTLAAEYYEKQAQLDPNSALAYNDLGFAYLDLRRYGESEKSFLEALRLAPGVASPIRGLCVSYSGMKKPQQALQFCGRAEMAFSDASIEYLLGLACLDVGRYKESLKSLQKALSLNGKDVKILLAIGEANYNLGRYEQAENSFGQALALNPDSAIVRLDLAAACLHRKHLDCALQQYQVLKSLDPALSTYLLKAFSNRRVLDAREILRKNR